MSRHGSRLAGILAAVPFLLALGTQALPTQVTPIGASAAPPPLAFDQYSVDLGPIAPRPVVTAWFEFTNTSDEPVTITDLKPSCGCLNPQLRRGVMTYGPGQRGRFDIMLKTANEEPGPHMFSVTMKYSGAEEHEETVLFRLNLPEQKVTLDPPELVFYQLSGDESEAKVYVADGRDGDIEVLGADVTIPGVTTEVLPRETGPDGTARTPVRVVVSGVSSAGAHKGLLRIETSDSEFSRLTVPLYVEWRDIQPVGFERPADGE